MASHINGPLYWEQLGKSGRPIVFVHPNPLDHSCWLYQMDHFSTWYRCISVDLPGYGKSPTAQPGLTDRRHGGGVLGSDGRRGQGRAYDPGR